MDKISEDELNFVKCWGREDFDGAIIHLEALLVKARKPRRWKPPPALQALQAAMIIQNMGKMHFFAGRAEQAEQMFELADQETNCAPQNRMYIAEFYLKSAGDNALGLKWLNRIVEREALSEHSKSERFLGKIDFIEDARKMIASLSSDPNKSWVSTRRIEWSEVNPAKRSKFK